MPAPPARWDRLAADPLTSRVWVDGHLYEVTTTTTALLSALEAGELSAIIPGMVPEEQAAVWLTALFDPDGPFDLADARAVNEAVITDLTGLPATTAITLAGWLTTDWLLLDGYHLRYGTDLLTLAPRRLFAALYAFLAEHRYETREEADRVLFPPVLSAPTAAETRADAANFEAALAMAGTLPGTQ